MNPKRTTMPLAILVAFFVTLIVFTGPVAAQPPLLVDDFNLSPGSLLTANGWTAHSAGGTNAIAVVSPGLTYANYPGSGIGNAAGLTVSGEDAHRTFAVQSSGAVYAAFMVRVTEASTEAAGGYFFHLSPDPIGTAFRGRVFAKKDGSNNVAFGISKSLTGAADIAYTPFSYALSTTYLIVVKYTILEGATNDTVSMFIDPVLPGGEPGSPTVTATDTVQSDISPGTVALRQGSAATSPTVTVDGIRVGTSWASVTTASAPAAVKTDFDGDGESDYGIVRTTALSAVGSEIKVNSDLSAERGSIFKQMGSKEDNLGVNPGTNRVWWIANSGDNSVTAQPFGTGAAGEIFVPDDFDGDGKSDIAVWRSSGPTGPGAAFFYVLNSETSTVSEIDFGVAGDNPTVTGDYDGDGKADPAVFRCPSLPPGGQCFYFFKGSLNNPGGNITYVPWGNNAASDVFPNRGDFDGDGKLDFCIQRTNPAQAGQGQFVLYRSSDSGVEYVNWNTNSALIVPGDYDGDGRDDFMTVRVISGTIQWALLTRTGATSFQNWGTTSVMGTTEFIAQGDYDGDGRTDIAIYRRDNTNPDNCYYYILRSSDGVLQTYEWGATTDTPINGWDVN